MLAVKITCYSFYLVSMNHGLYTPSIAHSLSSLSLRLVQEGIKHNKMLVPEMFVTPPSRSPFSSCVVMTGAIKKGVELYCPLQQLKSFKDGSVLRYIFYHDRFGDD